MPIVRVALPVPLPQLFDYTAEDADDSDVGRCVRVPFGRGDKSGVIVALPGDAEVASARLKPVHHIQRDVPPLPADWLELVGFVARYYHARLGEVVALALPPGLRRADGVSGEDVDPPLDLTPAGQAALAEARRESRALALLSEAVAAGLPARRSVVPVARAARDAGHDRAAHHLAALAQA